MADTTAQAASTETAAASTEAAAAAAAPTTTLTAPDLTPEQKTAADAAAAEAASKTTAENDAAEDTKLAEDAKSADAKVKEAAEKRIAEKKAAKDDAAEDAKLAEDAKSADATVKAAAEKRIAEKAEAKKAAEDAKKGAPEKYEPFKVPEGQNLDAKAVEAFAPIAKKHNLSQAAAQEFVDMYAAQRAADMQAMSDNQYKVWNETKQGWVKSLQDDKEHGGEKYNATVTDAKAAIKAFGHKDLASALEITGGGDHPAVILSWAAVGRLIREHNIVLGAAQTGEKSSGAQKMFPSMPNP